MDAGAALMCSIHGSELSGEPIGMVISVDPCRDCLKESIQGGVDLQNVCNELENEFNAGYEKGYQKGIVEGENNVIDFYEN